MSARISSLPTVVSANILDTDILPIVTGIAANLGVTKRVSVSELRLKLGTTPPAGGRTVTSAATYLSNNAVFNVKDFGAFGDGATNDAAAVSLAITQATIAGGTVLFPATTGAYILNADVTVPVNITLRFDQGTQVSVSTTKTLTINGHIDAGFYKILGGAGTIVFGNEQTMFYPEWFGVVAVDGTAAASSATGAANVTALQKLFDSIPGQNNVAAAQQNRLKSVLFRSATYDLNGMVIIQNRRIIIGSISGSMFATTLRQYSTGGPGTLPIFFIKGNVGTGPGFADVSGEITFKGLGFEGSSSFTINEPMIQIGGLVSGATFTAQGAGPVTGIDVYNCRFAQVWAAVRFTFAGMCSFEHNLVDGTYYGVMLAHGVQHMRVFRNVFNSLVFNPVILTATGSLTNGLGGAMNTPRWLSVLQNKYGGAIAYGGTTSGYGGIVRVSNDATNLLTHCEVRGNDIIGVSNAQEAVFSVTDTEPLHFDFVSELIISDNYMEEYPGMATHWASILKVGSGSDKVYAYNNRWNITTTSTWYSLPSSVLNTNIPDTPVAITIANNATFDLPVGLKYGELEIIELSSTGDIALFLLSSGSATPITIAKQNATTYTITSGGAGTINAFFNGGTNTFRIENKSGGSRNLRFRVVYT